MYRSTSASNNADIPSLYLSQVSEIRRHILKLDDTGTSVFFPIDGDSRIRAQSICDILKQRDCVCMPVSLETHATQPEPLYALRITFEEETKNMGEANYHPVSTLLFPCVNWSCRNTWESFMTGGVGDTRDQHVILQSSIAWIILRPKIASDATFSVTAISTDVQGRTTVSYLDPFRVIFQDCFKILDHPRERWRERFTAFWESEEAVECVHAMELEVDGFRRFMNARFAVFLIPDEIEGDTKDAVLHLAPNSTLAIRFIIPQSTLRFKTDCVEAIERFESVLCNDMSLPIVN
eukprot:GHVO01032118.1.p1 GENE.GHVO01032118.1~~GHVO01032118.1.p1  ORF type:complete len:319 (-),score=30.92 GHVO01032118.1:145-1023(-)